MANFKLNPVIKRTPAEIRAIERWNSASEACSAHYRKGIPTDPAGRSVWCKEYNTLSTESGRASRRALDTAHNERGEERSCSTCGGEGGWEEDQYSHSFGHYTTGRRCPECEGSGEGSNILPEEDPDNFTEEELKDGLRGWDMHLECSGLSPDEDEERGCSYCARLKAAQDAAESDAA